jgi:hypothetical protein
MILSLVIDFSVEAIGEDRSALRKSPDICRERGKS